MGSVLRRIQRNREKRVKRIAKAAQGVLDARKLVQVAIDKRLAEIKAEKATRPR